MLPMLPLSAGNKCSYKNCGKSRRSHGLHMFTFPVKDKERCKQWVFNSGVEPSLLNMPDLLKKRQLCEEHFAPSAFRNVLKQSLNTTAVPKPQEDAFNNEANDVMLPFEQVFVFCEPGPLETNTQLTTLDDEEPLVVTRTKNTKTY